MVNDEILALFVRIQEAANGHFPLGKKGNAIAYVEDLIVQIHAGMKGVTTGDLLVDPSAHPAEFALNSFLKEMGDKLTELQAGTSPDGIAQYFRDAVKQAIIIAQETHIGNARAKFKQIKRLAIGDNLRDHIARSNTTYEGKTQYQQVGALIEEIITNLNGFAWNDGSGFGVRQIFREAMRGENKLLNIDPDEALARLKEMADDRITTLEPGTPKEEILKFFEDAVREAHVAEARQAYKQIKHILTRKNSLTEILGIDDITVGGLEPAHIGALIKKIQLHLTGTDSDIPEWKPYAALESLRTSVGERLSLLQSGESEDSIANYCMAAIRKAYLNGIKHYQKDLTKEAATQPANHTEIKKDMERIERYFKQIGETIDIPSNTGSEESPKYDMEKVQSFLDAVRQKIEALTGRHGVRPRATDAAAAQEKLNERLAVESAMTISDEEELTVRKAVRIILQHRDQGHSASP